MSIRDGDRLPHRRILTGFDLVKCGDRRKGKGYNGFIRLGFAHLNFNQLCIFLPIYLWNPELEENPFPFQ